MNNFLSSVESESGFGIWAYRDAVLVKPDPRPEVDRLAFEPGGRDRALRIVSGTEDILNDDLDLLVVRDLGV